MKLNKRLGQHLLTDETTIAAITQAIAPAPEQNICEIGPGLGAITLPVLKAAGAMNAIEIDPTLSGELLRQCQGIGKLTLHQGDVLKFDFHRISEADQSIRLIGNLPYNISTPLLFHLLQFSEIISDMHFMLQKEVAERITAAPKTSAYSRLSVIMQSSYKVESLFDIAPHLFSPPPKVTSRFIHMLPDPLTSGKIHDRTLFSRLVKTAFQQRRKTIKNSLAKEVTEKELQQADIDPRHRPQEISVQRYINLANLLTG